MVFLSWNFIGSFLGNSKNKDADNKYDDEQEEPHPHSSVPDGAN
jgi:hypothetical protein